MSSNWNYECVANSNVNRLRHVKSVHKMSGGMGGGGGEHKCTKIAIFDDFGGVVTIATADTPKVKLRMCVKVKCKSFDSCEKCAQNLWGGTNVQKHQFLTILGGRCHSNGRYPQTRITSVCRSQM